MVRIDMTTFVRNFQPEKLEAWMRGKDIGTHPEDPNGRRWACGKDSDTLNNGRKRKVEKRLRQVVHCDEGDGDEAEELEDEYVDEEEYDEQYLEVCKDFYEKAGEYYSDEEDDGELITYLY